MALSRRVGELSSFSVSGIDDNELNRRWRKVLGSDGDDTITFNRIYQGGWGQLNLGDGHDTVVVSAEGDWTLLMIGVDEIYTDEASTTLTVISDATFDTNGSFISYTAGYGTQVITFTGLVGDTEVSLGDSEDQVYFSNASTSWRYKAVDDDTVDVYDLNTGYRARLNGTNIENLVIEAGEDPDEAPVDVQLEEVPSDAEGGTSIAVTVPEPSENDPDPIIFDSTSIRFTPQLGGFANAYGYLKDQNNGLGTSPTDGFYYGYHNYMQNLGYTRLTRDVESTIDLNGADKYFYSPYYNQQNDGDRSNPLAYRTTYSKAFDGWLSVYLEDTDGHIAFSVGATRIIMGSDDSEAGVNTGAVLDQSSGDSNQSNYYLSHYFNQRGDAGYAMYGWGGNDSIVGGSYNDTIWGGTGDDTIVGGQGNDRLFGEAGADVFAFSADADISVSGAVSHSAAVVAADGGNDTGADQVRDFDATTDFIRITVTSADTTWNIGTHVLVGTALSGFTDVGDVRSYSGSTYLVQNGDPSSTSDAFEIAVRVTSDGTATATGSTAAFNNASAAQGRTMVNLTGTSGADTLTTGANADTVLGMGGNDTINGGGGADSLDGGAGNDSFTFATSAALAAATTVIGGTDSDTITITAQVTSALDLDTGAGIATVESLVLTGGSTHAVTLDGAMTSVTLGADGSVVLSAAGQDVTGSSGADTVSTGSVTSFLGTQLSLGGGTDTLLVATNATDISAINAGAITGAETLVITGLASTTMTAAQHADFTTITAAGTEGITINSASTTISANAAVESYVLSGAGANTITLATATQGVTTASNASVQTINTGTLSSYTGTIVGNGVDTTTLVIGAANVDVSGATLNIGASSGVEVLAHGGNSVTLSSAQHDALIGISATAAITGSGTITIDTADTSITADASVSAYVLTGAGANTITLAASTQSVQTANDASAQTVDTGSLTTISGTFIGNATATDILSVTTTGTDISTASGLTAASNWNQINLANGVSATMTAAQYALVNTAAGINTITLTSALTGAVTLNADVETFVLAAGANSVTSGANGQNINADALLDGEQLSLAGSDNVTVTLVAGDLSSNSSGNITVDAGNGASNITTALGNDSIAAGDGDDFIVAGAGVDTVDAGNGDDTVALYNTAYDGADDLAGSFDTDTLEVLNDVLFTGSIREFETIKLREAADLTIAAAELGDNTITTVTGVNGGVTETVTFTGTAGADAIDLSNITTVTDARLIVTAGDNADIITGSGSADSISGEAGNDSITGGAGVDTMDGGAGADTFVYTAATDTGTDPNDLTTMDKIIGLSASDGDVVDLSAFADAGSSMVTYVSDDEWLLSWTSSTGTVTNYVLLENTGLSSGLVLTDNGSGVLTADVSQNISAAFSDTAVTFTAPEAGAADLIKVGTQAAVAGLSPVTIGGAGLLSYSVTHTSASDAVLGFLQFQPSGGNTRSLVPDGTTYVYTGTSGDDDGTGGVDAMLVTSAIASKASNATLVYSYGHAGNDAIVGFSGVDVIYGGAGNDSISGGMGADTMTGGAGFDTFEVDHGHSGGTYNTIDVIDDFVSGDDAVDYSIAPVLYGSEDRDLLAAFGTSAAFDAAATLANTWFNLQLNHTDSFYFVGNSNAGGAGGYLFFSLGGDTTYDAAIGFLGIGAAGFDLSDII